MREDVAYPSSEPQASLYQLLGVGLMASQEEIKNAWKRQALLHHPDRHGNDMEATRRFQAVQHAYEVLKDKALRAEYDKALLHRLYLEEYLGRFADLILTTSGLELPLERDCFHRTSSFNLLPDVGVVQ